MDKTFTAKEILKIINVFIKEDLSGGLILYTKKKMEIDMDNEDIFDYKNITLIQAVGLLAYQDHFIRHQVVRELLKETHYSVSDFCKENDIEMDFCEIIAISKLCKRITDSENLTVKTKVNKNKKEVRMFEVAVLKKVFKL